MRMLNDEIAAICGMNNGALKKKSAEYRVPVELLKEVKKLKRLQVVNFAAGGIATPADASLMMQLGADGNFVGSGIFKSKNPEKIAKAIVQATLHYDDPKLLAKVSKGLGEPMRGLQIADLKERLQERGV